MLFLQVCASSCLYTSPEATHFALIMPGNIFQHWKILTTDCCRLTWHHLRKLFLHCLPMVINSASVELCIMTPGTLLALHPTQLRDFKTQLTTHVLCHSLHVLVLSQLLLWDQLQFNHATDPGSDLNCCKCAFGRKVIFSKINSWKSQLTPTQI